jgi:ATP-dependent Lon protease
LAEVEEILNQQVGFEEQKEKVLNSLKIKDYCEKKNVKKDPLIFCLVGPPGVGKTTFVQLLAQALNKKLFTVALGGVSNCSVLLGTNESSLGTETGQLTKALTETQTCDPLILLDEVDKVNYYGGNSAVHDCLNAVLDPTQNQEVLDYYLDVKLDFSQVTFVVTVNEQKKIPKYLLSKTPEIVDLPGYNLEQKKEIANKFIQRWFSRNSSLNQNNFEIIPEALETLINKTREKGVRQLKSALDSIFDYCLLQ